MTTEFTVNNTVIVSIDNYRKLQAERDDLKRQLAAAETLCQTAANVLDSYASKEFYMGSGGGYRHYHVVTKTITALRSVANTANSPPAPDTSALVAAVNPFVEYLRQRAAEENTIVFAQADGRSPVSLTIGNLRKLRDAAAALAALAEQGGEG